MSPDHIWKVIAMRWFWHMFFFNPANLYLPCPQKKTTFGFDSAITEYEEFSMSPSPWVPWILFPPDPVTDYNVAIMKAITILLASTSYLDLNNCLILISDGENTSLFWFVAWIFEAVVEWMKEDPRNRCTCVRCYYVGTSPFGLTQFTTVCSNLNAPIPIQSGDPW